MGFLGKILKVIAYLPALITGIEPLFGAKRGAEKRSAAVDLVGLLLNFTEAVSTKDIVDQDKFQEGLGQAVDGIVKMLNASVWYKR